MTTEIPKVYEPQAVENKWYAYWLEKKLFSGRPAEGQDPFTIVIPPPNVTGILHMGHALNNTLQDIIIRSRRMQGFNALWVPGTDHGGIATQNVVEKLLKAEGKTRHDLGREKFLERMLQWKGESGGAILKQLQKLGSSLDWDRARFTMDETCSRAVYSAFVELYRRGLIYRGQRLVNWCPRCQTALADIEVEHEEEIGKLWHIKYPVMRDGDASLPEFIIVATTRPETMLGDTGVAVNPEDQRYAGLVGRKIRLPLVEREIPVVADAAVDPTFGTGAVKVTPSHDTTDFDIALRHNLPHVVVIDTKGAMTPEAGAYAGLDRYAARKKLLEDLEARGLLLETVDHPHAVGRCYRCATAIEPLVSEQWFMKVEEMSRRAMKVVEEGKVRIHPESWAKPYLLWLENLRDWCISRQIWWGHRIPVYYCKCRVPQGLEDKPTASGCPPIVATEKPERCPACGGDRIVQDPDVLDTWFSSALWPFSVFGWHAPVQKTEDIHAQPGAPARANPDLDYYYPTSVLVTGHEILYLWVARMIQMGLELVGDIPFREVFIHGIVRDRFGKKMSKSLGNVIDPLGVMEKYGTDALRFALAQSAAPGRDMQLSDDSFVGARNFANKIWNASRFVVMHLQQSPARDPKFMEVWPLELADRWILSEYRLTVNQVTEALASYNIDLAARLVYDFFWSKYCDWYIELAKIRLVGADENARNAALSVLTEVLSGSLRLMHPVMPFITEEIWQALKSFVPAEYHGREGSIMTAPWPEPDSSRVDSAALEEMKLIQDIVTAVRTIRSEMNVPPARTINVALNFARPEQRQTVERSAAYLRSLGKLETLETGELLPRPAQSAMSVVSGVEIFIPLAGLIDLDKEKQRLAKELKNAEGEEQRCRQNLANASFIERAPESEVERVKSRLANAQLKIERLRDNLKHLA